MNWPKTLREMKLFARPNEEISTMITGQSESFEDKLTLSSNVHVVIAREQPSYPTLKDRKRKSWQEYISTLVEYLLYCQRLSNMVEVIASVLDGHVWFVQMVEHHADLEWPIVHSNHLDPSHDEAKFQALNGEETETLTRQARQKEEHDCCIIWAINRSLWLSVVWHWWLNNDSTWYLRMFKMLSSPCSYI